MAKTDSNPYQAPNSDEVRQPPRNLGSRWSPLLGIGGFLFILLAVTFYPGPIRRRPRGLLEASNTFWEWNEFGLLSGVGLLIGGVLLVAAFVTRRR